MTNREYYCKADEKTRKHEFERSLRFDGHASYSEDDYIEWLNSEYRVLPDPCPFCGCDVEANDDHYHRWSDDEWAIWLECHCGYHTRTFTNKTFDEMITAHNRVCR